MFEAFKRYADFTGRSGRSEYWLFFLFVILIALGVGILNVVLAGGGGQPNVLVLLVTALYGIFLLAILIPSIAVGFRRLHDTNRSAWWILISFLPLIGSIVLIVFYCLPGTPGPNRFGPAPGSDTGDLQGTFS